MTVSREDGQSHGETIVRPTFEDSCTFELDVLQDLIVNGLLVKTTGEDSNEDLVLFRAILEVMKATLTVTR